jgi:hypothetical protein
VLARAGDEHQPAAPGEALHVPTATEFGLGDLADLGIVRSRFWQHDYSDLMC